jgi:hypothetical protein
MYKLQFKQGLGYRPVEDEWMECRESVAIDPSDVKKGTKLKTYKMKIEGVRMPYPESPPEVKRSGYLREDDKAKGKKAGVGSQSDGKGHSRAKRADEGGSSTDE